MNATIALDKELFSEVSLHPGRPDSYERFPAALFGTPERVPVVVQPGLYAMALHRLSSQRFFREPDTFAYASHHMATLCGFDGWLPVFDVFNIEAEALGQALVWRDGMEPWADRDNPLLRERSDLDRLTPPSPGKSGRMPFVIEVYRRFAEITGVAPVCVCCAPFSLAALLRGIKPLIVDMYRDPGYVDRLLTFLTQEVVVPWVRRLAETTGTSTIVMCDPLAGSPALSPSLERRFRQGHVQKVIRSTNSPSCAVLDGRSGRCEGQVADASLVTDIKLLDIRPDLLRDGPQEQIVDAVCRALEQGRNDGRFALLMHNIPVGTPVEHLDTVVTAVKQFGRYPIAERLPRQAFRIPETLRFQQWTRQRSRAC
jgi:uroporphyrinogen-III decarboxylase